MYRQPETVNDIRTFRILNEMGVPMLHNVWIDYATRCGGREAAGMSELLQLQDCALQPFVPRPGGQELALTDVLPRPVGCIKSSS